MFAGLRIIGHLRDGGDPAALEVCEMANNDWQNGYDSGRSNGGLPNYNDLLAQRGKTAADAYYNGHHAAQDDLKKEANKGTSTK
jgi:hypothetical protein